MIILRAGFVLPITSPPIKNGAVAIDGDRIAFVGTEEEVRVRYADEQIEDLGDAAIIPGLVNCHSHLEITSMRGALDSVEGDFTAWLIRLTELRKAMSDADLEDAAYMGALEGARAGVTCFGDIGRYGFAGLRGLKRAGLRGIVYQETEFSPDNKDAAEAFRKLVAKYEELCSEVTDLVGVGISPHAPYTVGSKLFEMIAQHSIIESIPITIHAAESAGEIDLMTTGSGLFADVYEKYGVEWNSPVCGPIEYLEKLGVLAARPLLAHCVMASDADIERIAASGSKIAHCPKSNAKFGHGVAPFEKLLDAGVAVGLGSDSVASNNVCDLLEESRFAAMFARNRQDKNRLISAREALRAATLGGAEALGLDRLIGSLEAGKQADIAVVSLGAHAQMPVNDVEAALVFSSNAGNVVRTIVAGKVVSSISV
jgi:cytosine/adenosine deaminase-related metal-dependent hydrolase